MDENLLYYIWLSSKLYPGSHSPKILLEHYKDIKEVYKASFDDYTELGVSQPDARRLADKSLDEARQYFDYCKKDHIGLLTYDSPYYPGRLKVISNPPPLLYYRGRLEMLDDYPCFAMVGTRSCSESGFRNAYKTAYKAAYCGAVIVNGLALGIDGACMTAALDADGYAVGLLGCGIDRIYPAQNKELFLRLSRQGLILSEFSPFSRPEGKNFPVRNRVISGLSVASVIFEADAHSGAMITAEHTLEQGRKLYAMPGNVGNRLYEGPLELIKSGSEIITDADDILTEYALMFPHRISTEGFVEVPPEKVEEAVKEAFSVNRMMTSSQKGDKTLPKPKKASGPKEQAKKKAKTEKAPTALQKSEPVKPEKDKDTALEPEFSKASDAKLTDLSVLSASEKLILSFFDHKDAMTLDEIVAKGVKVDDALSSLTLLEVYGFLRALPGGRYEKC